MKLKGYGGFALVLAIAAVAVFLVEKNPRWTERVAGATRIDQGSMDAAIAPVPGPASATAESPEPVSPPQPEIKNEGQLFGLFSASADGKLVKNQTTRLNIEQLHALNTSEELVTKLRSLSAVLPPDAHAELLRLTASYINYIDDVQAAFPPEAEVQTVGEAEAELKGIHELRIKHFGPEVAEAFFGEEERMGRRIIELMALEADPSIPLAEKAHRAQLLMQSEQPPNGETPGRQ